MSDGNGDAVSAAEAFAYQAKEVSWFVNHEGWARAVQTTEARIVKEWMSANDPLSREMQWHKLQAFKTLQIELRVLASRKLALTE